MHRVLELELRVKTLEQILGNPYATRDRKKEARDELVNARYYLNFHKAKLDARMPYLEDNTGYPGVSYKYKSTFSRLSRLGGRI